MQFKLFLVTAAILGLGASASAQKLENYPIATGKYEPTWESTAQWECPEWYKDAKFGIWAHWGPQCEPEYGDWYARYMYYEGHDQFNFHKSHYGDPNVYGLKELCRDWKAENWNPERLVSLYKSVGARYFFTLGNHHDNFDLWESPYQEWNSVNMGPERDIVKGWSDACKQNGLPLGISFHAARAWLWLEKSQDFDGNLTKADGKGKWWEGYDPQELYAQRHTPSTGYKDWNSMFSQWDYWNNGASQPSQAYKDKFQNRTMQCITDYRPDIIYFDDTVLPFFGNDEQVGLNIMAHYYNTIPEPVMTGKILQPKHKESMLWDVERGIPDLPQEKYWQTCTCIGDWHYSQKHYQNNWYKSAQHVVNMLIDICSKNGNLLLSVPLRGDGTLDEKEEAILRDIKAWMDVNGRSIYGTRVWKSFGEGPLVDAYNPMSGPGFNESINYSARDVRYVIKHARTEADRDTVFATIMRWPSKDTFTFQHLGRASQYFAGEVESVELLGSSETVETSLTLDGLTVSLPAKPTNAICPVFAITFKPGTDTPLTLEGAITECEQLLGAAQPQVGSNTGRISEQAYNTFAAALEAARQQLAADAAAQAAAKQTLLDAWKTFRDKGTIAPTVPAAGGTDLTSELLHEARAFSRTAASKGVRWGEPQHWTVENYYIPTNGQGTKKGLDNWPGFENLYLGVWDDRASAQGDLHNTRIYQRVKLQAGQWFFGTSFDTHSNLDDAYLFVADDILTTAELPAGSIAHCRIDRMPIGNMQGLTFTLDSEQEVVLGFQADLSSGADQQEFRAKEVRLQYYGNSRVEDVTSLYITNPSFEDDGAAASYKAPVGWDVDCNCAWWGVNVGGGSGNPAATDGTYLFGVWDGSATARASISQKITLPAGTYRLSVDMHASNRSNVTRVGRQRVFAGEAVGLFRDQVEQPGQSDEQPMQTIYVDFEQETEGELTIGVTTGGAPAETWFKIDNFRLQRSVPGTEPETAVSALQAVNTDTIYTLDGVRVERVTRPGVYIVNQKKQLINI